MQADRMGERAGPRAERARRELARRTRPSTRNHNKRHTRTKSKPVCELAALRAAALALVCLLSCALAACCACALDHAGRRPHHSLHRLQHQQRRERSRQLELAELSANSDEIVAQQSDKDWRAIKEQLAMSLNDTLVLELHSAGELERARFVYGSAGAPAARVRDTSKRAGPGEQLATKYEHNKGEQVAAERRARDLLAHQHNSLLMNEYDEPKAAAESTISERGIKQQVKSEHIVTYAEMLDEHRRDGAELGAASGADSSSSNGDRDDEQQAAPPISQPLNTSETASTCPNDHDLEKIRLSLSGDNNLTVEQQLSPFGPLTILEAHNEINGNVTYVISQCIKLLPPMIKVITEIIAPILFSIIIVVGLLGNIIVMLVILEDRKTERELTPANLLILDLSLADLSFIIFCVPFTGWDYAEGQRWVFGQIWCKFNQYLIVVCALSSIYTLVLMSIDRFMAIVYPIECISYRTSRNMLHAIVIKWVLIFFIALPTLAMHGLRLIEPHICPEQYNCRFLEDQYRCRFLDDQYNPLHFQIVFFVTSYLLPLVLIFCLYLSLLTKLWFGIKPHGHKESLKMLESKKKVTWLVASIVIVFALCWCPIQIMLILMRLKIHDVTATYIAIQVFAHTLGYMNSCINPIVYAFASETFNQSFKRSWIGRTFLRCCCCCATCFTPVATIGRQSGQSTGAAAAAAAVTIRSMSLTNVHPPTINHQTNSYQMNQNARLKNNGNSNQMVLMQFGPGQSRNKSLNHIFSPSPNAVTNNNDTTTTSTTNNNNNNSNNNNGNNNNNSSSYNSNGMRMDTTTTRCSQDLTSASTLDVSGEPQLQHQALVRRQTGGQRSPAPLALEPRDRPSLSPARVVANSAHNHQPSECTMNMTRKQTERRSSSSASASSMSAISQTPSSSGTSYCEYETNLGAPEMSVCSQAAQLSNDHGPSFNQPKQQLIARMIKTQNGSEQTVEHGCEPCARAEKMLDD